MAFALIACDPEASEKSFRKLEAPARGGDGMVCVGELDVNFVDAVRIPLPPVDFTEKDRYAVKQVDEVKPSGVHVRAMTRAGMDCIAQDFIIEFRISGDAIRPGKVDQATRTGYLAGVRIASLDNI